MRYPFDWGAWWRYHRAVSRADGCARALPSAAGRALLALASGVPWTLGRDAALPDNALVIVGHQRSGTTWLHRMLAAQPGATALPLHALLLPADAWQHLFNRPRPASLDRWQDRLFGPSDSLHRVRLHEPEEDEFALWALFRSPMNALDRPWPSAQTPLLSQSDAALSFYAQVVARHVRRTGRRYVGKNPHFTSKIPQLREALPGVKIVACWRHPEEAIPSRLSLIREIWRRRGLTDTLTPHEVQRIYAGSVETYLGGLDQADLDIRYSDLVADPHQTVARIHEVFGLGPFSPEAVSASVRAGPSRHRYGLAEFGLEPSSVARDLAQVYARFGFLSPGGS